MTALSLMGSSIIFSVGEIKGEYFLWPAAISYIMDVTSAMWNDLTGGKFKHTGVFAR